MVGFGLRIMNMLAIEVNINGKNLTVNCEYCPAVPLDPHDFTITAEPERIIVDKILDQNSKVIKLEDSLMKIVLRECMMRIHKIMAGVI